MAVRINTNIAALRANSDYSRVDRGSQSHRAKLASGLAVNSGKDGGARLSVSEGMRAEIGGLSEGVRNAESALDLLRTAEGAMGEISGMLIRMRELAVESSTGTLNDTNRESLDAEFNQIKEFIDRTSKLATYNGQTLLSGFGNDIDTVSSTALTDESAGVKRINLSGATEGTYTFIDDGSDNSLTLGNGVVTQTVDFGMLTVGGQVATGTTLVANFDSLGIQVELAGEEVKKMNGSYADGDLDGRSILIEAGTGGSFQLGSDAVPADRLEYDIKDMHADGALINLAQISIGTQDGARGSLAKVDETIDRVAQERGVMGAIMNRLEYTLNYTSGSIEGLHASESTVRDTDFAWETTKLARNKVLEQASTSVMLQAQIPVKMVMSLLQ
jgi:flagellin